MTTRRPEGRLRALPPVTTTVVLVTLATSIAALVDADLSRLLTRDAVLVRAGQWWRMITPILVQPDGWGQLVFNLAGAAVVGAALERRCPRRLWCSAYLVAGLGSIAILTVLRPGDHGGGSSHCVAGLVGALAVTGVVRGRSSTGLLATAASAYSAFFCSYLTGLDLAGVWPAMVAGDVSVAVVLAARRHAGVPRASVGLLVLVTVTGVVMAVQPDGHGIGLLVGAGLGFVTLRHRSGGGS